MDDMGTDGAVPSPNTPRGATSRGENGRETGTVPPGGEGADSGSVDAVGVTPSEEGEVANESATNDIAGVGTRDESAAHPGERTQTGPREAQNFASEDDKIDGILLQTQADLPHATAERTADVIAQRLHDAGIARSRQEIEQLAARISTDE